MTLKFNREQLEENDTFSSHNYLFSAAEANASELIMYDMDEQFSVRRSDVAVARVQTRKGGTTTAMETIVPTIQCKLPMRKIR